MNNLDTKILDLFRYLIDSGTKYLVEINYTQHKLHYIVNGREIKLTLCKYTEEKPNTYSTIDSVFSSPRCILFDWCVEFSKTHESEIGYKLTIDGKTYTVPKLQRIEQAHILDRIESTLKEKESGVLDSLLDHFSRADEEF